MFTLLHPATRILCWVAFAILVQFFTPPQLLLTAVLVTALLARGAWAMFLRMFQRARWLLCALILIYGWATPGEALLGFAYAPSSEGIQAGLMQAARLALMLAALSVLLAGSQRSELLAGIHCLMRPWARLGWPAERATARLWLTLHYAEIQRPTGTLAQRLQAAFDHPAEQAVQLTIEQRGFSRHDAMAAVAVLAGVAVLLL